MIVYQEKLGHFREDVIYNQISDKIEEVFREKHISGGSEGEIASWNNSLHFMKDVLDVPEFPEDCDVAIEYNIPQTSKRVDFMILGSDQSGKDHIVIIELKQWSRIEKVNDTFKHSVLGDLRNRRPVAHPSYQAYSYKALLLNYGGMEDLGPESINPCAYLHNMPENYRNVVDDKIYAEWIDEAPAFLKSDVLKIRSFISQYIHAKANDGQLLYKIDFGRIRPTKTLQDSIDSMLCGNEEFKMIDEQIVAYDLIMNTIRRAGADNKKHVLVIQGGPGTGKSVLAINVLADAISKLTLNAAYITKNATPRKCYSLILAKGNAKKMVDLKLAFRSPHQLPGIPYNGIDVGLFDEAHRMQSRPYMYKGKDMLEDAINACRVSVFFIDEDQRVTTKDCYSADSIAECANRCKAVLELKTPFELQSQFRCDGSDGYMMWLDSVLNIRETANTTICNDKYDFRVFDAPEEMKAALIEADAGRNKSRMCAGYCYDWDYKHGRDEWDIKIGSFKAKWNLPNDETFAINPDSMNEVGCIHTVQGMEFDYVGVLIGRDLRYADGKVITDKNAISKDDKSSGIRTCKDEILADRLIRNTYKVLLSRGQKGCFVYCEDELLREYLKEMTEKVQK